MVQRMRIADQVRVCVLDTLRINATLKTRFVR